MRDERVLRLGAEGEGRRRWRGVIHIAGIWHRETTVPECLDCAPDCALSATELPGLRFEGPGFESWLGHSLAMRL